MENLSTIQVIGIVTLCAVIAFVVGINVLGFLLKVRDDDLVPGRFVQVALPGDFLWIGFFFFVFLGDNGA